MNIVTTILTNTFSNSSPLMNAAAVCSVNGQVTECPAFFATFMWFMPVAFIAFLVLFMVASWKVYVKAGQPGWAALIPIYNVYIITKIIQKPAWWTILVFIPFVNWIMSILFAYYIAKAFGKDIGFTLGLILLNPIFLLILAFDDSRYVYGMTATVNVPQNPVPPQNTMPPVSPRA
jgi:hypothetical protein